VTCSSRLLSLLGNATFNTFPWKHSALQKYQMVAWQPRIGYEANNRDLFRHYEGTSFQGCEVNNRIRGNVCFHLGRREAKFQSQSVSRRLRPGRTQNVDEGTPFWAVQNELTRRIQEVASAHLFQMIAITHGCNLERINTVPVRIHVS
jgi:hypothetical protein